MLEYFLGGNKNWCTHSIAVVSNLAVQIVGSRSLGGPCGCTAATRGGHDKAR